VALGWHSSIWSWNLAPKIKCFWWLVIQRSILTWDNLVKRGFCGPGICALCSDDSEDIDHLFVFCRYTKHIWTSLVHNYNFALAWGDLPLSENYANSIHNQPRRLHFPILVCWILWKARNKIIFDHIQISANTILYQIIHLFGQYPEKEIKIKRHIQVTTPHTMHLQNIGTFDGAAQSGRCGGGGNITFHEGRIYHFKVGLGAGTNNRAELLSLWALLWLAKRLDCDEMLVLGDSQLSLIGSMIKHISGTMHSLIGISEQ